MSEYTWRTPKLHKPSVIEVRYTDSGWQATLRDIAITAFARTADGSVTELVRLLRAAGYNVPEKDAQKTSAPRLTRIPGQETAELKRHGGSEEGKKCTTTTP